MNKNQYCVIMAGGAGTRFWPMSRESKPKQFLDILNSGSTFIRNTFERFINIIPVENIYVSTNSEYKEMVLAEIPELKPEQVLCEPIGRNTAPCIAYAAMRINAINPNASIVVTPSDHYITNEIHFCEVIQQGLDFVEDKDLLLTIGLTPTHPNIGYGYIQINHNDKIGDFNKVKTFTEKPNLELAQVFVDSGEYFWNSGIFIWKVSSILSAIKTFLPEIYDTLDSIKEFYGTPQEQEKINQVYGECRGISIDFGVMERAENVYVRCSSFGWSDIGTWGSLYEHSNKDNVGNTESENTFVFNTTNCLIKIPKDRVAIIEGLEDYIVVDTDDVLMICPRSKEQKIKKYIETVRYHKSNKFD